MKEIWNAVILLSMIFCHVVDDFYLQGILAKMKQKNWWKENYPDQIYRQDYMVALMFHAFSWAFMTHLPLVACMFLANRYPNVYLFFLEFLANLLIHMAVDDEKANKHRINLVQDQTVHLLQVTVTFLLYMYTIF